MSWDVPAGAHLQYAAYRIYLDPGTHTFPLSTSQGEPCGF